MCPFVLLDSARTLHGRYGLHVPHQGGVVRSTGFSKPQLATLRTRDDNRCVWTGNRDLNVLTNGLLLDSIVNGLIESDPTLGVVAKAFGVKVERWADPADVPVFYTHDHAWYALEGDTRRQISGAQAVEQMHTVYGPEWFEWWAVATETAHSRALANLGGW